MTNEEEIRIRQQMIDCTLVKAFEELLIKELEQGHADQVHILLQINVNEYTKSIKELARRLDLHDEAAKNLGRG